MKSSISSIIWALISISVAFFFLYGSWGAYKEYQRVQNYSGHAVGQVMNKHFKQGSDGGTNYYIDYWFMSSPGQKRQSSKLILKDQWDMLSISDKLEIRYDPSDPNRNMPTYGSRPSLFYAFFMLVLGFVFMAFGASRLRHSFHKKHTCK